MESTHSFYFILLPANNCNTHICTSIVLEDGIFILLRETHLGQFTHIIVPGDSPAQFHSRCLSELKLSKFN